MNHRAAGRELMVVVENLGSGFGSATAGLESVNEAGVTASGGRYSRYYCRFPTELGAGTIRHRLVLVEASPEEHREVARLTALDDRTWNPLALSGSLLLVRNDREAAAYDLRRL